MAVVTFNKTPTAIVDPWDQSTNNVLIVDALIDDVPIQQYSATFPDPTADAVIQAWLEADLAAKGYI